MQRLGSGTSSVVILAHRGNLEVESSGVLYCYMPARDAWR